MDKSIGKGSIEISGDKYLRPPAHVTHYTSLSGLKGIIDNRCIWASNVLFLNDTREMKHGLEAFAKVVEGFTGAKRHAEWIRMLKSVLNDLGEDAIPDTYAACFCTTSDVLSQWRGYADTEGVAVTFSRSGLEDMLKPYKAKIRPIIYGNLKTTEQLTAELRAELERLDDLQELIYSSTKKQKRARLQRMVCRLIPQFKHFGFRDEREWRFVIQDHAKELEIKYRVAGGVMVPYIELGPEEPNDLLPIVSIRVGPGRDQDLRARSVKRFIDSKGYTDVDVKPSAVPFRI